MHIRPFRHRLAGTFLALGLLVATGMARAVAQVPAASGEVVIVVPLADSERARRLVEGCERRGRETGLTCRLVETGGTNGGLAGVLSTTPAPMALAMADPAGFEATISARIEALGLPVIAVDTSILRPRPISFIGVNNRDIGRRMAEALKRFRPEGGTFAVLTDTRDAAVTQERWIGLKDGLGANWHEIERSPVETRGDFDTAVDRAAELFRITTPGRDQVALSGIVALGAWPMLAQARWQELVTANRARVERRDTILIVADATESQISQLKDGLVHALVATDSTHIGAAIAAIALKIKQRQPIAEISYVAIDILTRDSVRRAEAVATKGP